MKTEKEIKAKIKEIESFYEHVLHGTIASIQIDAPRALMQIEGENKLRTLHWVLGTKYKSKLKGIN